MALERPADTSSGQGNAEIPAERTFAEFFAGIGLMRVGLESQGWKCTWANDFDPLKDRIYRENFGADSIDPRDVRLVKGSEIPSVSLATASFPCQDLSEAGPHNGIHGPRSNVYWEFLRVLEEMKGRRPPLVLVENVRGFMTRGFGADLVAAIKGLNDLGYTCDAILADAKHFVPQSRTRVFLIGVKGDLLEKAVRTKMSSGYRHTFRPERLREILRSPGLRTFETRLPNPPKLSVALSEVLEPEREVPSDFWFTDEEVRNHLQMMSPIDTDWLKAAPLHGRAFATMYRRMRGETQRPELRKDGLAGCLRVPRGGSSKQFLVISEKGDVKIRRLTGGELSRLMGVPRAFRLPTNYLETYKALGDAVAVPVVEWLVARAITPLFEELRSIAPRMTAQ